jgi:multiple sugar transport system substrate-binding protein
MVLLLLIGVLTAACAAKPTEPPAEEEPVNITVWSHWVDEPALQKVINQIFADYESEHPNVNIEVEYSQKADFLAAAINAFTVGEGGPDLFYVDREIESTFTIVDAGWAAPLEDIIDWNQMLPAARDASTWESVGGETHTWYGMMEAYADMILYNPKIFDELGIVVPENFQFTADEFYDVAVKCREAGYDPIGAGSGDRKYPGTYIYQFALISKLGMDEYTKLWNGEISWDDPRVRETLEWVQSLVEIPAFPATYSTMLLAESFQYFHTQQKACMFTVGTWYTGRTFKSPEEGGQPLDFRNGFLRYPAFPDGVGTNEGNLAPGAGFMVWKDGPNREVAEDIVRFMLQEEYGTLWILETGGLPAMKYDPAVIPSDHPQKWYFDAFAEAYDTYEWKTNLSNPCPDLRAAYDAYINDGLAPQLVTVDEAITAIEEASAICQGQ